MSNTETAYIAIDLHTNNSTIGYMNQNGEYMGQQQVKTTSKNLANLIVAIPGDVKKLTLEQSNMAFWAAKELQDYVDELIVCEPRHNALIYGGENKNDGIDTLGLCTLLRLNHLKAIWRPKELGLRRVFFLQIKQYHQLIKQISIHKRQIQDGMRHWGMNVKLTRKDYKRPEEVLSGIDNSELREEFAHKLELITYLNHQKEKQLERIEQTGTGFWEIAEFLKIPGVGPVGAHTYSGYIQTPHRFRRSKHLIKYCKLAVRKFTSDGKRMRSERLSKAGHGCLKNLAHIAWKSSMGSDNEVRRYYQACLDHTGNPVHARLNTQRKILITMWALWKNEEPYDPTKFTYNNPNGDSDR